MSDSAQVVLLVPAGKIKCYISGSFRKETPEEHVRQRVARSLVEEYKYNHADIEIEFPIKVGSKTQRVDIAIFPPGVQHTQQTIAIIAETKRDNVKRTDR